MCPLSLSRALQGLNGCSGIRTFSSHRSNPRNTARQYRSDRNEVMRNQLWVLVFVAAALAPAYADAAFLLEEPYGKMGTFEPMGHAAVYLTHVCASSPTRLRPCKPGEPGVVISRYHRVGGDDWIAIPLLGYLYAVDTLQKIPASADADSVAELRDAYRRAHFLALIPNDADGHEPPGDWTQLVGSAYDRKLYGFQIETSPEQDTAFIRWMNRRKNKAHFNLFVANCADFSRNVLNFYAPHAVHRNYFADAGMTTPKQVAKSLASYAKHHPTLEMSCFQIPQVPGSIPRSRHVDDVAEGLLKSKKYVIPLAVVTPPVAGGVALLYLTEGRFSLKQNTGVFDIARAVHPQPARAEASTVALPKPATLTPVVALKAQDR